MISLTASCPFSLNILSMRSVIRKPLTMFVTEANTAIAPSTVLNVVFCSPAMMTEPTTAIAEIALVSDISGVCSSRETFWITWKPTNVASIKPNSIEKRSRAVTGVSWDEKPRPELAPGGCSFKLSPALRARRPRPPRGRR